MPSRSIAAAANMSRPRPSIEKTLDSTVVVAGTRRFNARLRRVSGSLRRSFPFTHSAIEGGVVKIPFASQQVAKVVPPLAVKRHDLAAICAQTSRMDRHFPAQCSRRHKPRLWIYN